MGAMYEVRRDNVHVGRKTMLPAATVYESTVTRPAGCGR